MRKKRSRKDYGGGSGKSHFDSRIFSVVIWRLTHGIRTTITWGDFGEIHFDGKHPDLNSDKACVEQLTGTEILRLIVDREKEAFRKGENSRINEFKSFLRIR